MEDPTNTVYVSSIVIAEIVIKASLGKLELGFDPIDAMEISRFETLDFSAKDALLLKDLPCRSIIVTHLTECRSRRQYHAN